MKIVFLIDDLRSGGAQRQMVALAKDFKTVGHEVSVLFYYPQFYYANYLEKLHIEVKCLHFHNPFKRIFLLRKTIRGTKPNAVIAFMGVPSLIAELASLPRKNWVLIVGERSADPKILRSAKSKIIRYLHVLADHIVANSYANIEIVKKVNPLIPEHKLKVIYNSIDLNEYHLDPNYIFKKNDVLRIIVLASYRSLKNPLGLIEAVNLLDIETKDKIIIDWYGDKSNNKEKMVEKCEYLIDKYHLGNIIRFNDVHSDISNLMQDFDAVGLFSFFEGLPNSICEGMACGKVIISSRVSDIPLIISELSNGFLFDPQDIISISNALKKAINSTAKELKQMGENNRLKAEELFSNHNIFRQYLKLIE
jgi:glycosyltransferase involved in cell wall biosynthesis